MLFYLPSYRRKETAMRQRAVRQQQLFDTIVEKQKSLLPLPAPIQSEVIVLLGQLMRSVVDAIEREANDEQDHH
jgi:hypothetical protein